MREKIAIVGYSCRLPKIQSCDLWANLLAGNDLVGQLPADRWAQESSFHLGKSHPGTSYSPRAGTIGDVSRFDATFFAISPREAEQMDPQQRLLLEMAWEALESGGVPPASVRGQRGSVYIGFSGSDWSYRRSDDLASFDASTMTGQTGSIAANRISYLFDLTGPSVAVDTACSSSLVAFHQACQSIQTGEADFALAGGISLHLHPLAFVGFSRASMLSPRGICNVFDAAGDGYVRSEGGGIFLLKSLDQAVKDGNKVYAVVGGSGVNCDGRTNGMTVPGHEAQAALLRDVYARAGIDPADIDYLEAHGTGTAVGDPIECHSLGMALGQRRTQDSPLLIGSVKSNMGHLETASGVAGLVKAILCLQHRSIPPTIHLKTPNPNIKFDEWNLKVVTDNTPLDPHKQLTIGINSFGFGGANAHVVLQSPTSATTSSDRPDAAPVAPCPPLLLSARGEAAVKASATTYANLLDGVDAATHYDVAYSAALHRDFHPHRLIAFGDTPAAQRQALAAYVADEKTDGIVLGTALSDASKPVFVYSGNGSQWVGMGRDLLDQAPVFLTAVRAIDAHFTRYADFSIEAELRRDDTEQRLAFTEVAQPLLFAIQVGLTEMLRGFGAEPGAVVGHSVGEVAAAWACGALSLAQAVRVIHERSTQQGHTKGMGCMTAVGLSATVCKALLDEVGLSEAVAIAGINSARGVTLAGAADDLQQLEAVLAEREIFHRRLDLDYAFHSSAMDPIRAALEQDLVDLKATKGALPFYSTVTGGRLSGSQLNGHYWWRNIREPVQFQQAIDGLIADGFNLFIEMGPHAVLRTYINDGLRAASIDGRVVTTLQRGDSKAQRVKAAFYQLLVEGALLDLGKLFPSQGRFVDIPTYPWQRERYWHPLTSEGYNLINRYKEHPLLGYRLHENKVQWENHLDTVLYPNLADHAVGDAVVFPAAGFVEMALAAARLWHGEDAQEIEELEILAPLLLEQEPAKTVRFAIDETDGRFTIHSRERLSDDAWTLHVVGRLPGAPQGGVTVAAMSLPTIKPDAKSADHYALTTKVGLNYGPAYQAVDAVWSGDDAVTARFVTPTSIDAELGSYHLPPTFLDGCFQLLVDILRDEIMGQGGTAFVPVKVGRLRLYHPNAVVSHAQAQLLRRSPRSTVMRFCLYAASGQLLAELDEVRFRAVLLKRRVGEQTGYLHFAAVPRPHGAMKPSPLATNVRLSAAARGYLHHAQRHQARAQYYEEVEPLLDVLCASFAQRALQQLTDEQGAVDIDWLLATGKVRAEFRPYLQRLIAMLKEDGVLEPHGEGLTWSPDTVLPAPQDIWSSLLGDYPDYAAEILLLGRVGEHLSEVLDGTVAVESLIPVGAAHPVLAHYLSGSPSLMPFNHAVADLVVDAQQALAAGARLRVLDYSSGRSQLAAQLLPRLDMDRCDYQLVVPNAVVLESMEMILDGFPSAVARVLGQDDFSEQAGGCFDIVLLSQELAAADDPAALLSGLSAQLVPGGVLVVAEQPSARWSDLVFGLQSDWWRNGALDRPVARSRSAKGWRDLLTRFGLSNAQLIHDLPDREEGPYLLIARTSQTGSQEMPSHAAETACWLIVKDQDGEGAVLADLLAAELRAAGQRPCLVAAGSKFRSHSRDDFELPLNDNEALGLLLQQLAETHGQLAGIVLLTGLSLTDGQDDPVAAQRCMLAAELAKVCEHAGIDPQLLLVTSGAVADLTPTERAPANASIDDATLWGFGRTLMNEFPDLRIRLLELADPHDPEATAGTIAGELLLPDAEDEVIYSASGRYVPRLRTATLAELVDGEAPVDQTRAIRLDFTTPGPLKHLIWRSHALPVPNGEQVEIAVKAAGLNFRDVMYAMGLLSDEAVEHGFAGPTLGMELSGVVTGIGPEVTNLAIGDEVIAFAPASFAERVVTPASAVARKPTGWSFNAAATVPTTFFTAYYALHHLAQLEEGERLLIHGAAGGVGLAAIQLGKALGAEIFATAGSDAKRDVVRLLGADHVLDSRSLAFADDVLALTNGQGVDVVLNSLAGEAINRNLRILRPFGRFMELGKRDFYENTRIGLRPFRNNISYFGIDADQLMAERPALTRRLFGELMQLFTDGSLKPLPYRAFPAAQAVEAFRYMQQSRQIGKVVLNFEDGIGQVEPQPLPLQTLQLDAKATYLVTGGMRGFGLETARWLASKGARHLVLLSRRGAADEEGAETIEALQAEGVQVHAVACDVTDKAALRAVFDDIAQTMPPLRGLVHAAMVIDDGLVRSLTAERIRKVLAPKVLGARHLDELTRGLALDFFVVYSSATTLFGNPGQASYVAANRYLELLAHSRRAAGLPALAVCWGAIDDVGYLARNTEIKAALQSRMGGAALSSSEALNALEQLLSHNLSGLGVMELEWGALRRFLPTALSPKFQDLAQQVDEAGADAEGLEQLQRWLDEMGDEELAVSLGEMLKKEIGEILHVSPERIEDGRSLYDLGMDSLMGMEMVAAVEARFGVTLPVMALSEGPTVSRLVERIIRQLRAPQADVQNETDVTVARIAAQHATDTDAAMMADVVKAVDQSSNDQRSLTDD